MGLWHSIRRRWHPLWRLRRLAAYRWLQERMDRTIYIRLPGIDLRVAVKLWRDASWTVNPESREPEVRAAFALVLRVLKPAVFWDVGANIGYYSWLVRQCPAVQRVVMFEPDLTNYALITDTIRTNGLRDCRALPVALSDRCGEAQFLLDRASGATGSLQDVSQPEAEHSLQHAYRMTETITCATTTVDRLLGDGVPPPNFIKIDVEGAERLVLAGSKSCLEQHHPVLLIETSDAEFVRQIRDSGYRAFRIDAENVLFIPRQNGVDDALFSEAFPEFP